jgi:hypothetical protein
VKNPVARPSTSAIAANEAMLRWPVASTVVGERAADEHGREHADALERQDQTQRASGAGQRERAPAEGDDEGRVAEQRDRLAGPEQPEVAALEGLQDAGAGGCGSGRFHGSKAILMP